MKTRNILLTVLFVLIALSSTALAQRDYLNDEEIELVRDAQQIDKRINILTRAADRRFNALGIDVQAAKPKKGEDWGPEPTGTRTELWNDIRKILQKAADDINNLAERPDSIIVDEVQKDKKPKGFKDLFPLAVRNLSAAAGRYRPVVAAQREAATDRMEIGIISGIADLCDEIIAAVDKLPAAEAAPAKRH